MKPELKFFINEKDECCVDIPTDMQDFKKIMTCVTTVLTGNAELRNVFKMAIDLATEGEGYMKHQPVN